MDLLYRVEQHRRMVDPLVKTFMDRKFEAEFNQAMYLIATEDDSDNKELENGEEHFASLGTSQPSNGTANVLENDQTVDPSQPSNDVASYMDELPSVSPSQSMDDEDDDEDDMDVFPSDELSETTNEDANTDVTVEPSDDMDNEVRANHAWQ